MRRWPKQLLLSLALLTCLVAWLYLNAKEDEMSRKIMMYYGGFEVEEMFDARQWFASGQYKPRNIEADGGASNVTMLRTKPMPFTRAEYDELPFIASGEMRDEYPDVDMTQWIDNPPDFSHRIRYAYSAFAAPNKPEDYYYLYLELAGRRFVITFSRDAQSGGNLTGKDAQEVIGDYASQAMHRQAFAEIEALGRKTR